MKQYICKYNCKNGLQTVTNECKSCWSPSQSTKSVGGSRIAAAMFTDIIVRNNLLLAVMDQCIYFLREENQSILPFLDTPQLKADSFVLASFVNVQITLILQWYLQNFTTPAEEMVRTYQRLLYRPLLSYE